MNFKQQIAKYVTGNMATDQLPEIGMAGLREGLDTPSLRILAGLSKNESSYQIEHYFKLTLEELNISLPHPRQAAIEYALGIVNEILDGKKDVIKGTAEIRHQAIDSFNFYSESNKYLYDSISFETVYGLFDTYEELLDAVKPWQTDKTNEQLLVDTKAELLEELAKWKKIIEYNV